MSATLAEPRAGSSTRRYTHHRVRIQGAVDREEVAPVTLNGVPFTGRDLLAVFNLAPSPGMRLGIGSIAVGLDDDVRGPIRAMSNAAVAEPGTAVEEATDSGIEGLGEDTPVPEVSVLVARHIDAG